MKHLYCTVLLLVLCGTVRAIAWKDLWQDRPTIQDADRPHDYFNDASDIWEFDRIVGNEPPDDIANWVAVTLFVLLFFVTMAQFVLLYRRFKTALEGVHIASLVTIPLVLFVVNVLWSVGLYLLTLFVYYQLLELSIVDVRPKHVIAMVVATLIVSGAAFVVSVLFGWGPNIQNAKGLYKAKDRNDVNQRRAMD